MRAQHLIKLHAHLQKLFSVAGIACMGRRRVVGGQRVGEYANLNAVASRSTNCIHDLLAGDEIRRNDQQLFFCTSNQGE